MHTEGSSAGTGGADAGTLAAVQAPWTDSTGTFLDTDTNTCVPVNHSTPSFLNLAS